MARVTGGPMMPRRRSPIEETLLRRPSGRDGRGGRGEGGSNPGSSRLGGPRDREGPAASPGGGETPGGLGGGGMAGRAPRSRDNPTPGLGSVNSYGLGPYGDAISDTDSPTAYGGPLGLGDMNDLGLGPYGNALADSAQPTATPQGWRGMAAADNDYGISDGLATARGLGAPSLGKEGLHSVYGNYGLSLAMAENPTAMPSDDYLGGAPKKSNPMAEAIAARVAAAHPRAGILSDPQAVRSINDRFANKHEREANAIASAMSSDAARGFGGGKEGSSGLGGRGMGGMGGGVGSRAGAQMGGPSGRGPSTRGSSAGTNPGTVGGSDRSGMGGMSGMGGGRGPSSGSQSAGSARGGTVGGTSSSGGNQGMGGMSGMGRGSGWGGPGVGSGRPGSERF